MLIKLAGLRIAAEKIAQNVIVTVTTNDGDHPITGITGITVTIKPGDKIKATLEIDEVALHTRGIEGLFDVPEGDLVSLLRDKGYRVELDDSDLEAEIKDNEQSSGPKTYDTHDAKYVAGPDED